MARAQHALALIFLALVVCGFYVPQLVGGTTQFDGLDVHYSAQRYFSDAIRGGHLPFWTPYVFSGFPFLADLQVGAWYPFNWPFFLVGVVPNSITGELLLHTLIACGGTYALVVRLVGRPLAAVAAAMFYGLSGFFAAHSQHVGIFQTAAWLPWLVLLLDVVGDRLSLARLALAGVLGAMLALPGHFQTALYSFSGVAVWAVLDVLLTRRFDRAPRLAAGLAAMAGLGAALSAVMILPGYELARRSLRADVHAGDLDLGYFQLDSLLTLVQPDHFGVLLGSSYTGPGDVTQHYFYAGLLLAPLAMVGLLSQARTRRMALLLGLPFVWYALGPTGGLFNLVSQLPGFVSIELPMHGWFLPALGLALLGGAGLDSVARLLNRIPKGALTVGIVVVLVASFVDILTFNALQNRLAYSRLTPDELYAAPLRSLEQQLAAAQPPVERLHGAPLTSVGYRNHPLQVHVEATYGYNPLALATYTNYQGGTGDNPRLVNGLAATHYVLVHNDRTVTIHPNPTALPRAYFARSITPVPDTGTAIASLTSLDPAVETLVLEPVPDVQPDPTAVATVIDHGDDYLTVRVRTASNNLLRVAIPAYPGWHASLNGVELQVLTVDYALLGVVVPVGAGDIRIWFAPRWFWPGAALSSLALLATLAALIAAPMRQRLAAPARAAARARRRPPHRFP